MSLFGEIRHDISRLAEIAQVMSRHGFGPSLKKIPLVARFSKGGNGDDALPAAERFARMLEELGPTFVKLGQILSTRGDLVPPDYTTALARLQDRVPPFAFEAVKEQIEADLGAPLAELFESFDETPLASASMAQVHAASLGGEKVVVKVLRPGIHDQVKADASILVLTSQLLEVLVSEARQHRVGSLAQEFEQGLRDELDFRIEVDNLLRFTELNADRDDVHVPFVIDSHCSNRVITMERIFGTRFTDMQKTPEQRAALVDRLMEIGYEHFFMDGLFHADPHPGNLFLTDDNNIAFIDFGLVGKVSPETQNRMLLLLLALALKDASTVARLLVRIGDVQDRVDLRGLRDAVQRLLYRYDGRALGDTDTSTVTAEVFEVAATFGIRTPREFALLSKASVALDGLVRTLHPEFDPSAMLVERAQTLLRDRFDPRAMKGGSIRTLLQAGVLLHELPLQLNQTLMDLEGGNLRVLMKSDELVRLERDFRGLGMTVFSGLIAAAFVSGGIAALAETTIPKWLIALSCFGIATLFFLVAFTWFVTGGRVPKLSASALLSVLRPSLPRGPTAKK